MTALKKIITAATAIFLIIKNVDAQNIQAHLNSQREKEIEKTNLINGNRNFHSAIKPFYTDSTAEDYSLGKNYRLDFSPITNFAFGYDKQQSKTIYDIRPGIAAGFSLKNKLYVWAAIKGGFSRFNQHYTTLADSIGHLPMDGNFKNHNNNNITSGYYEFYIKYTPMQFIGFSIGKGKKHIGDGIRSTLLSCQNSGMEYFDLEVNGGKLKYVFSANMSKSLDSKENRERPKYLLYHVISWNPARWLNISGFEAVTLSRRDSAGNALFINPSYLNPALFFRPVEYSLGSPDNELLGIFGKIRYAKKHFAYAQIALDEYNSQYFKENNGWWAEKYAGQIGFKGYFLPNSTLKYQMEYNRIRPYMYSHENAITSYSMFSQPLANPYGANLEEFSLLCEYQINNFLIEITADYVSYGKDFNNVSYGNNILRPYTLRQGDYGNSFKQGEKTSHKQASLTLKYYPKNLFNTQNHTKNNYIFAEIATINSNAYFLFGLKTELL